MLLFRSLSLGLLGALVWLLATHHKPRVIVEHERQLVAMPAHRHHQSDPTIIDVAPNVTDIASLIRLAPNERVIAVDDHPATGNLDGTAMIGTPNHGQYIDLTIGGGLRERRVLVLIH